MGGKTPIRAKVRQVAAIALLAGAPAVAGERAESAQEQVDRAIRHHGGAAYEASLTELELCSASGCSRLAVRMDGGVYDYLAEGQVRDGVRRVRSTNDTTELWVDGESRPIAGPDEERRLRDWVMSKVYFCFLPYRLNDPGVVKEDLGTEVWDGRELRRIKVRFEPGTGSDSQDEFTYWLEPDTGRVELFAYSYERGGPGLRFRRGFNYRRLGGILFFDQENWGVEGEGLSVDDLTPEFVASRLRRVSTVELRGIRVTPLTPAPSGGR